MERTSDTAIPKFGSLEEERAYWEARGPLAEGRKGQVNRPRPGQKRSSFLAVRLTGEELTRLRDTAAQLGLGPSTFARLVLMRALENPDRWRELIASGQFRAALQSRPRVVEVRAGSAQMSEDLGEISVQREPEVEVWTGSVEVPEDVYRAIRKEDLGRLPGTIGNPDRASLWLMDDAQMKQAKELALPLLRALLAIAGVQLITPEDENYEKVRDATTASR